MIDARATKIRERLLLGYSVPILLSIAAAALVFWEVGEVKSSARRLQTTNDAALNLAKLEAKFYQIQKAARGYFLTSFMRKNDDFLDEFQQAVQDFDNIMNALQQQVDDPQQQALLKKISELQLQVEQADRTAFVLFEQGKGQQGTAHWHSEIIPKIQEAERLCSEFETRQQQILDATNRAQSKQLQQLTTVLVISTALATLLAIVIAVRIASSWSNKIVEVVGLAQQISDGDLTLQVNNAKNSSDEISQLLTSFQNMTKNLNALVQQVQQLGIRVSSSSVKIAASGKQLEATVIEQVASTQEVVATAKQIAATSTELVHTTAQVDVMAQRTTTAASTSKQDLVQIEKTMRQLTEATHATATKLEVIREKANNINAVVVTITKVADQTNLLSLNAAIEAEKAGESGLGFSVVAREIRRLADQTAVATLDIEQMVQEMQTSVSSGVMEMGKFTQQVDQGVSDVSRISHQLGQVIQQVQALAPQFALVSQGMEAQTQGAQQISTAMEQLSETSVQTADSLGEINAAIEQLNQVAQGLRLEMSRFKVRHEEEDA
jgi:methyl-accepting chemotaxis protein WspA